MPSSALRRPAAVGASAAALLVLAACSSAGSSDAAEARDLEVGAVDLSDVCPATVVMQTDWNPEAEHGHLYELVGEDYEIDTEMKAVRGPLMAGGEYAGVDVEIRSGGPAIGYQAVPSALYQDEDILLGYVKTDEAVQTAAETPTVSVMAPLEINPQMIMWDPETYPEVETIEELADAGAVIRHFGDAAYMQYFIGAGIIPAAQSDGSYDGTPAAFVAAGGRDGQQGFASAEPYIYEHEVEDWGKPVAYQTLHDAGYEIYSGSMAARADRIEEISPCLEELVPVLQQATLDYFAEPEPTNELILELVEAYDNGWVYSEGVADYAVETMLEEGLAGNGPDETVGNFDDARMARVFDIIKPLFSEEMNIDVPEDLTVEDIYTNEFIDESIGF